MPVPVVARSRLLVIAEEVSAVHAEIGDARAHGYLAATIDALAHALVDLGDGCSEPTRVTPLRALPGGSDLVVPSSAVAAAVTLRRARAEAGVALGGPDGIPAGLAREVLSVLADLAATLQWVGTTPAAPDPTGHRARVHRDLRRAHRRLQPAGTVPA